MEIVKLLDRVIAQNEIIIQQNVELLIILGVLVENRSNASPGTTKQEEPKPQ
jgi:hypothetical protein